jgi:hypothetical protein
MIPEVPLAIVEILKQTSNHRDKLIPELEWLVTQAGEIACAHETWLNIILPSGHRVCEILERLQWPTCAGQRPPTVPQALENFRATFSSSSNRVRKLDTKPTPPILQGSGLINRDSQKCVDEIYKNAFHEISLVRIINQTHTIIQRQVKIDTLVNNTIKHLTRHKARRLLLPEFQVILQRAKERRMAQTIIDTVPIATLRRDEVNRGNRLDTTPPQVVITPPRLPQTPASGIGIIHSPRRRDLRGSIRKVPLQD